MTRDEIRSKREELDRRIARLNAQHKRELAIIRADVELLQSECPHTNRFTRSIMGRDEVVTCPDCGWEQ